LQTKENDYLSLCSSCQYKNTLGVIDERTKIQNEHDKMRTNLFNDLLRSLIRTSAPLDIRFYETRNNMLKDIYNFQTVDSLLENLFTNQLM
jgi:hypothetical protein